MATFELKLFGLTCGGCINKVTEALVTHAAVEQVDVTLNTAEITGSLSADEAIELIEQLGFEAEEA